MQNHYVYPKENTYTLGELIKVMIGCNRKSRIRGAIIAVSLFLISFLVLFFGYYRPSKQYVSVFNYGISTFDGVTYYDGTQYNYLDMINIDNLTQVKDSDPQFKNIDVERLYYSDSIKIARNTNEKTSNVYGLTISAKSSYFSNFDQAKAFIEAVIAEPIDITNEMLDKINNERYLNEYKTNSYSYDQLVTALMSQAQLIIDGYDYLLEQYNNRYLANENGSSLRIQDVKTKAVNKISSLELSNLKRVLETKPYVYDYESELPVLEADLASLRYEYDLVDNQISVLQAEISSQIQASTSTSVTVEGLNSELSALLMQKETLDLKITLTEEKITNGATVDTTAYDARLEKTYNELKTLTTELTAVEKEVYKSRQNVYYESNSVITETSNGLLKVLIVSVGVAVLGAFIVNLFMDLKKYHNSLIENKEEKKVSE